MSPSASASAWQHIVATFDGTRTKFYIDGSYVGQLTASFGGSIEYIGNDTGGNRFADYLDDFRVYGVTLSAWDITTIYGRGNGDIFPVTAGSSYATATATLLETGGADTTVTVVYDSADKGITEIAPINSNLSLWLDASELTSAGATWTDKSGNGNHATKHNTPTIVTNAQNGLSIMRYDKVTTAANTDYHEWNDLNDIRTIFAVYKRNSGNDGTILNDDDSYHFFPASSTYQSNGSESLLHSSYAHDNVQNGLYKLNGTSVTGTSTNHPTSLSIHAIRTSGNVKASRIGRDRDKTYGHLDGDYGEILIFNTALSISDISKLENYLAVKWGLSTSTRLGEDGTVRVVRPQVSSLVFTDGTLTIDSDKGEIAHSDGSFLLGEFTNQSYTAGDGSSYSYKVATYTADTISLGSGVVINLVGDNPVSLRTRNNGNITLGSTINLNGGSDPSNLGGTGKAGGFNGGAMDVDGYGPARERPRV